jgi:hypothetical protein
MSKATTFKLSVADLTKWHENLQFWGKINLVKSILLYIFQHNVGSCKEFHRIKSEWKKVNIARAQDDGYICDNEMEGFES